MKTALSLCGNEHRQSRGEGAGEEAETDTEIQADGAEAPSRKALNTWLLYRLSTKAPELGNEEHIRWVHERGRQDEQRDEFCPK